MARKNKSYQRRPHHRRAKSLNGSKSVANISYVLQNLHVLWHVLFGNMNAEQICNEINMSEWKPKGVTVVCRFINGSRVMLCGAYASENKGKRNYAWSTLFRGMYFEEAIDFINSTWLDPSYHLYIID